MSRHPPNSPPSPPTAPPRFTPALGGGPPPRGAAGRARWGGGGGGGGIHRPRLLCRLWLLRIVLHGFPFHQAIAVPPAARRCDGELAFPHEPSCQNGKGKLTRARAQSPRCGRRRTPRCLPAPARAPGRGGSRGTSPDTTAPR